jgi:hypothetical protein
MTDEIIPLFSLIDRNLHQPDVPTYYFNFSTGKVIFGSQNRNEGYAITINRGHIILPQGHTIHDQDVSKLALEHVIDRFGLGSYTFKNVTLEYFPFNSVNAKFASIPNKKRREKNDIEAIFDNPADYAVLILYFHDQMYDNSGNYKLID